MREKIFIRHDRKRLSIAQWADEFGVNRNTAWTRWRRGERDFNRLFGDRISPRLIKHQGKEQTIAAWARDLGISRQRLHKRLETMSIAEALSPPTHH